MIEINLLSQEEKVKTKKIGKLSIEPKYFLYIVPLILALLILVHLCIATVSIVKNIQFGALNNKWQGLKPQRDLVDNLKKQYDLSASDAQLINQLDSRKVKWSDKLNRLSTNLPSGIWFNEIQVSLKDFILKASVASLEKEEMSLIKAFIDNLKKDTLFLKDFTGLELSSVQKKSIGGYDVIDFILTANLSHARNTEHKK